MTWRTRHPSEIPREEWLARLDTIPNASPYLLPEWSLFWADVWPGAKAEVYIDGDALIPVVRRGRYGLNWRFAQPYGTDCVIGDLDLTDWASLLKTMSGSRTVEIAISADVPTSIAGWTRTSLAQNRWIINLAGRTYADLSHGFSNSHRRNITKGEDLQLRIGGTEDIDSLIRLWQDTRLAPRYMLNAARAHALIKHFAPIGSLHWRTAWAGERPVAGKVFLLNKQVAVSLDSFADRDPQFRGAGHFLVAHTFNSLINSGITHVDLGGVPGNGDHSGLDDFKSGWNATQDTIHTTLYRRNWYSKIRT